ncbi:MAG: 50S ribosomal protein P1 [Candidatus Heimdallarchaeota archaeon]|nr:50S ribosomal protein P1 [Candidatus Heimdallarchaeota archaeon]
MEYVYAALVLHELKQKVTQAKVKGILEAAGATVDESRIKALVAALKEVDINEALKTTVMSAAPVAAPAAGADKAAPAEAKEEKKEEPEEDTDLGLSALFG